VLDKAE